MEATSCWDMLQAAFEAHGKNPACFAGFGHSGAGGGGLLGCLWEALGQAEPQEGFGLAGSGGGISGSV